MLTFRRWLTIEALMFIVTVFGNILVVLLRTCFRDPLQLDLDSHRTKAYNQIDYLRSESTQLIVNVMTICLFPVTVFIFLAWMPLVEEEKNEQNMQIINFQAILQTVQLICAFYAFFVPPRCCCQNRMR